VAVDDPLRILFVTVGSMKARAREAGRLHVRAVPAGAVKRPLPNRVLAAAGRERGDARFRAEVANGGRSWP